MEDLSKLSDEALAQLAQDGHSFAAECLCERYKDLVRTIARPYYLAGGDRDDLLQEGMIGLYSAILHYQPGHKASFQSFAGMCVTRKIISAVKLACRDKHMPLNRYVSLSGPLDPETDAPRELADVLPAAGQDPEEAFLHKESESDLLKRLNTCLSPFEKQAAEKCVEANACKYSYFKKVLSMVQNNHSSSAINGTGKLPSHTNIRGKEAYK